MDTLTQRQAHRCCRRLIAELGITRSTDLRALLAEVTVRRQRCVLALPYDALVPYDGHTPVPPAMWVAFPDADYLLYAPDAGDAVREQAVLHQLGHLLLDHHGYLLTCAATNIAVRHTPAGGEQNLRIEYEAGIFAELASQAMRATAICA